MKIFYHNDLDGRCAGHIIAENIDRRSDKDSDDYIEIDYNMKFPFDKIKKNETVFILDYSIEPEEMDKLLKITTDVTWVDHHITAINKYKNYPHKIKGLRDINYSGCVLTYMWLLDSDNSKGVPMPIQYIGDRDTWQWQFGDETKYFCNGAELYDLHPLSKDWEDLFSIPEKVMTAGQLVERYKTERNREYLEAFGYETEFEGYSAIVINLGKVGSEIFGDKLKEKDIGIMYVHDGNSYHVGLRSEHVDVSEIAVSYGGGGHQLAAGFECTELPWIK
jgi:oligoribonuclease NrnB/cAMP/cGMP phosphodiesterase (DHH superfamily)